GRPGERRRTPTQAPAKDADAGDRPDHRDQNPADKSNADPRRPARTRGDHVEARHENKQGRDGTEGAVEPGASGALPQRDPFHGEKDEQRHRSDDMQEQRDRIESHGICLLEFPAVWPRLPQTYGDYKSRATESIRL